MSDLLKVMSLMAPPQPPAPSSEYQGLEYKWKMLVFRPAMFKTEAAIFGVAVIYLLLYLLGNTVNMSRARKAFEPYQSLLNHQFSTTRPLLASGPSQHLSYSTGRRNAVALHGTLTLRPYHNVVGLLIGIGKSIIVPTFDASEGLVWVLTLGKGDFGLQGDGLGVWAVVNKEVMRRVKEQRWDLGSPQE